jgi:hypothetical protein
MDPGAIVAIVLGIILLLILIGYFVFYRKKSFVNEVRIHETRVDPEIQFDPNDLLTPDQVQAYQNLQKQNGFEDNPEYDKSDVFNRNATNVTNKSTRFTSSYREPEPGDVPIIY